MISLTATASTSQLDQKQKVETVLKIETLSISNVIVAIPGAVFMNQFTAEYSDAIDLAKKAIQSEKETRSNGVAKAVIKCHTPYNSNNGSACVDVNGIMVSVHWNCADGPAQWGCITAYFAWEEPNCRC